MTTINEDALKNLPELSPDDAQNLHIVALTLQMQRLEDALRKTSSKRDIFNGGMALLLVLLVGGFSIIFRLDSLTRSDYLLVNGCGAGSETILPDEASQLTRVYSLPSQTF